MSAFSSVRAMRQGEGFSTMKAARQGDGAFGRREVSGAAGIGAVSIFSLVIILCLAVLTALTAATAHSSLVLAQRQAQATRQFYQNEIAAQTFVAGIDAIAASADGDAAQAIDDALDGLCVQASQAAGGEVAVEASRDGSRVSASFACEGGRTLRVVITVEDGAYRIDSWRTVAIVNEEQPMGSLYLGG